MEIKRYQKLVRDNIPRIIESNGGKAITRTLSEVDFQSELDKKLLEEPNEYLEADSVEELADIVEVIYAILDLKGMDIQKFEGIRMQKRERRGGFKTRCYLESVASE